MTNQVTNTEKSLGVSVVALGSMPKRAPLAWAISEFHKSGRIAMIRQITLALMAATCLCAIGCLAAHSDNGANVIKITARRFEFSPRNITLKQGTPVVLELTTDDRSHGFNIPAMNVRADVLPGKITELTITPQKAGEFDLFCDLFCGSGHEDMNGRITVTK
jgi:cytochrome c oxidase subunit 2